MSAKAFLKDLDYSVLQQCMHCGMCLPNCPTYVETKRERNSPRGRISWMRAIADGELPLNRQFGEEMYYCLGCLACVTACPAGVNYQELFETSRTEIESSGVLANPKREFYRRFLLRGLFIHPARLRLAARLLWFLQVTGVQKLTRAFGLFRLFPEEIRKNESLSPKISPRFSDGRIRSIERPKEVAHRVGMLTGCVQDIAYSNVNRDTVDVLLANGCEVYTPRSQPCCGSLHAHTGDIESAKILARRNIDGFDLTNLDAIITNAGGCGSHLKHYSGFLSDDPRYAERARIWDTKVKDIHEWLVEIKFRAPENGIKETVTYHDSCHLRNSQKITSQPRALLAALPNTNVVELPESDWCCGSAGIYNLVHPDTSASLLKRKLDHIKKTGATIVATANPGCLLQLENGAQQQGLKLEIVHPVTLLARAYRSDKAVIHR